MAGCKPALRKNSAQGGRKGVYSNSEFTYYNFTMSRTAVITGNQIADALRALDVNFILGGNRQNAFIHKSPARLIAALAMSDESRLRLSLIPLFLEHPEFATRAKIVAKRLPASRLADIDDRSETVLHQVNPRLVGHLAEFCSEIRRVHGVVRRFPA